MASASTQSSPEKSGKTSKIRHIIYGVLAVLALIVLIFIWNLGAIKAYSDVGTGYAARVVCSCRYIGERSLNDCEKDLEPGMEMVALSDDETAKRVTATITFLAEDQAEYRKGFGCVLLTDAEREALKE